MLSHSPAQNGNVAAKMLVQEVEGLNDSSEINVNKTKAVSVAKYNNVCIEITYIESN